MVFIKTFLPELRTSDESYLLTSVKFNLQQLLESEAPLILLDTNLIECKRSILAFGVEDIQSLNYQLGKKIFTTRMKHLIEKFECRIENVEISIQKDCANLTDLIPADTFGEPVGPLPVQTDSNLYLEGNMICGTWECGPGTMELDLDLTEFCHLLQGHWVFTSESGEVSEVKAGDSWVFPKGWKGKAEVKETVRKVYMMIT